MLGTKVWTSSQSDDIVFLHAVGFTGGMWGDVIRQLSEFRSITIDLPGHGQSRGDPFTTIADAADHVARAIADRSIGGPVHVVGLSLGAYVGLALAQRHPSLVNRAVLSGLHVGEIPGAFWIKLLGNAMSPIATTRFARRQNHRMLGIPDDSDVSSWRDPSPITVKTFRAVNKAAIGFQITEEALQQIDTPILALAGAKEHASILQSLDMLQRHLPNGIARTVPGLGHGWPAQDSALFSETVRAWIQHDDLPGRLQEL